MTEQTAIPDLDYDRLIKHVRGPELTLESLEMGKADLVAALKGLSARELQIIQARNPANRSRPQSCRAIAVRFGISPYFAGCIEHHAYHTIYRYFWLRARYRAQVLYESLPRVALLLPFPFPVTDSDGRNLVARDDMPLPLWQAWCGDWWERWGEWTRTMRELRYRLA